MQDCAPSPPVRKHAPVDPHGHTGFLNGPNNHISLLESDPPESAMADEQREGDAGNQANTTDPENPKQDDVGITRLKANDDDAWSTTAVKQGKFGDSLQMPERKRHDAACYTRTYCFHPQEHRRNTCACGSGASPRASTKTEQQVVQAHAEYTSQLVKAAQISAQIEANNKSRKVRFTFFGQFKNSSVNAAPQARQVAKKFMSELQIVYKNLLQEKHWDVYEYFQLMLGNGSIDHHLVRLLDQQMQWDKEQRGNVNLDVGIHYTKEANLKSICRHGLLNRQERLSHNVSASYHGRTSGDGIYTADNPLRFVDRFGSVGLIVLRLRGTEVTSQDLLDDPMQDPELYDTVVQVKSDRFVRSTTVRKSTQCAVLVKFDATHLVSHSAKSREFVECLNDVCGSVSDLVNANLNRSADTKRFFMIYDESKQRKDSLDLSDDSSVDSSNDSSSESWPRLRMVLKGDRVSSQTTILGTNTPEDPYSRNIVYKMPSSLSDEFQLQPSAYETVQVSPTTPEEMGNTWVSFSKESKETHDLDFCPICMEDMKDGTVRLKTCGHTFHLSCLTDAASRKTACPMCRSPLERQVTPRGHMPSGTLFVRKKTQLTCAGHPTGTIVLRYVFDAGYQKVYHPLPWSRYSGTIRVAYVPDTEQGRQLVDRLVEAFQCGLTFCIGTSLTTGRENVITWASIPHKTSTVGGAHGYPDPHYFDNCHAALDALHVNKPTRVQDRGENDVFYEAAQFGQSFSDNTEIY